MNHRYLSVRESKFTSYPGTDRTTRWVASTRLLQTLPPPKETSSFSLLRAIPSKTSQSGFLPKKKDKRKRVFIKQLNNSTDNKAVKRRLSSTKE